ncbi:MAG: helix-turn-helix transcriptional regulator [Deltaproteobacteria bacterium]|jgi:HTH-type transcriptional regulator / antitoxin HipB|nr:helix-turn-helix transcriptional regulator [Deltaproteobacteria bacterium]MBT4638582.1 helix-turn-helix transcriptional regulator [Deltaproteobacteria bacterium]MBT6502863.1 helix-turn-helix transcriptional regulator [Deltaproteobacteria bacterium]MBT7151103.1 helix-turn-helix transcriptional regulator [Deltaproteobacteria bacterium]
MTQQISDLILKSRKHAGLTQKELADLAGVAKNLIYELEKGKITIQYSNLLKVLHVLNIQIRFILPTGEPDA